MNTHVPLVDGLTITVSDYDLKDPEVIKEIDKLNKRLLVQAQVYAHADYIKGWDESKDSLSLEELTRLSLAYELVQDNDSMWERRSAREKSTAARINKTGRVIYVEKELVSLYLKKKRLIHEMEMEKDNPPSS